MSSIKVQGKEKPSQDRGNLVRSENWENLSWYYDTSKVIQLIQSVSWVSQSCLTLCDPLDCSRPGFPVHHQLLELAQTHVHQVHEIQPSHLLLSPSSAFNVSQHQGLFQWAVFFISGDQSIGISTLVSVLPMNIQDWVLLGWTGWISLLTKGLWRDFSNTAAQKHQFFGAQLSL